MRGATSPLTHGVDRPAQLTARASNRQDPGGVHVRRSRGGQHECARRPRTTVEKKRKHGHAEAALAVARYAVATSRRDWQGGPRDHVRPTTTTCRGRRRRAPDNAPRRPMAPLTQRSLIGEGAAVIRSTPGLFAGRRNNTQRCRAGRTTISVTRQPHGRSVAGARSPPARPPLASAHTRT